MVTLWACVVRILAWSQTLQALGTNLLLAVLGLATGVLAARVLGPVGRGDLAAIQTWPTFIAGFAMLGLPEAITYFSAGAAANAGRFLASGVVLILATAPLFMGVGYVLMPTLLSAQSQEVIDMARLYLLLIPFYALVGMPLHALRGRADFGTWNALRVTPTLGWLATLLVAGLVPQLRNPTWLVEANLAVQALLGIVTTTIARLRIPGSIKPDVRLLPRMIRFGLPSVATSVPQTLNLRLDQMLMALWLPPMTLGLYAVAVAWAGATAPALSAIASVMFPRVAAHTAPSSAIRALADGARLGSLVAAGLAVVFLIVTPLLFPLLFGDAYAAAMPAAYVLALAGIVAGLNGVMQDGIRGLGRPKVVLISEIVGVVVTIPLLTLFLRSQTLMGAAVASLLGYSATGVFLVVHLSRLSDQSIASLTVPRRADFDRLFDRLRVLLAWR